MSDLTSLVSTVGTVVAIGTSLFLLRQGQRDRRELREEQRRAQARQVTLWTDWNADSPETDFDRHVPAVYVANASDQTIYEVFVDYIHPADGRPVRIDMGPVPPHQTRHRDVPAEGTYGDRWEPSHLQPRLYFRDSDAQFWMRDLMGRLKPDPGAGNDGFAEAGGRLGLGLPRPPGSSGLSTERP